MDTFLASFKKLGRFGEYSIGVIIILLLALMIIPMPTFLMDFFLALNITGGLVILFVSIYILKPLEFSVFPGLLLIVTLFRLSLNVATTRLILGNGDGGRIIEAFGTFVIGGNYVVGFIIFLILVIINFVVITKGSTRVAEVAARFTLDAMPGKQMAIDADLNAGLIDDEQARQRRNDIAAEADFYGSMDGASKFVRGDAIAGLLITAINLLGGLIIGSLQMGLSIGDAAATFTLLAVGDGLVAQIPALIISTATGIVITRSSTESDLGAEMFSQIGKKPQAIFITSGTLFFIGILPGMPILPFTLIATTVAGLGYVQVQKKRADQKKAAEAEETEAEVEEEKKEEGSETQTLESLLIPDPFEIEMGYGLISLVDEKQGGTLLNRISSIRKTMAIELGMIIPPIRIRDNVQMEANNYRFKVYGNEIASGVVYPHRFLALGGADAPPFDGFETTDPTFGLPAVWITENQKEEAEVAGYTVVESEAVITTHLMEALRANAFKLLDRQMVQDLLENLKKDKAAIVEGLVPDVAPLGLVQTILKNLLNEDIPIRNLTTILETIGDFAAKTSDSDVITEYVRASLSDTISNIFRENQNIAVTTFEPRLEDHVTQIVKDGNRAAHNIGLSPRQVNAVFEQISNAVDAMISVVAKPTILVSPLIRKTIRKFIEPVLPNVSVISFSELTADININTVGTINFVEV